MQPAGGNPAQAAKPKEPAAPARSSETDKQRRPTDFAYRRRGPRSAWLVSSAASGGR